MKKLSWILPPVLIGVVVIFYFIKNEKVCSEIESKRLDLEGESQVLIAYSEIKNDLLYLSLTLTEDTTVFNIFGKENGLIRAGFSYGDYLNDSVMLVLDQDGKPFLYNNRVNKIDSLNSSYFSDIEVTDIKTGTFKKHEGVFLNKKDTLFFYDVASGRRDNLFSLDKLSEKYESIKSFDLFEDRILVCIKQGCSEEGCDYDYILVSMLDNTFKKIFTLEKIKLMTYAPMVSFLNESTYLTNYSDDQTYLLKNSIDGRTEHKWCIDSLEIFNIETVKEQVYLTVLDEQARKNTVSKNGLKKLYSGISIITVDLSDNRHSH